MSRDFNESIQDTKYEIQNTRIEAYDISNISGQNAVGSMVVFENGVPNKAQYRKFKIKTVEGSNDVAMMREVLSRRFNNDWSMPDLVLLDGGLGHLNMAEELLHKELGLAVNLVAVAKGPTRKKLDIRYDANLQIKPNVQIESIIQDDNLVKSIMDEAHRFAIGYHRKLRSKASLS
jgi:excinuclease ABC subunit C